MVEFLIESPSFLRFSAKSCSASGFSTFFDLFLLPIRGFLTRLGSKMPPLSYPGGLLCMGLLVPGVPDVTVPSALTIAHAKSNAVIMYHHSLPAYPEHEAFSSNASSARKWP